MLQSFVPGHLLFCIHVTEMVCSPLQSALGSLTDNCLDFCVHFYITLGYDRVFLQDDTFSSVQLNFYSETRISMHIDNNDKR